MAYDKFKILESTAVPLPIENIDTDQIIPARFLKATERIGFGDNLFRDWRYISHNIPKKDFVLNNSTFKVKYLLVAKTLDLAPQENMQHGLYTIMALGVLSLAFLQISLEITV
jgi:hypothetical protein